MVHHLPKSVQLTCDWYSPITIQKKGPWKDLIGKWPYLAHKAARVGLWENPGQDS